MEATESGLGRFFALAYRRFIELALCLRAASAKIGSQFDRLTVLIQLRMVGVAALAAVSAASAQVPTPGEVAGVAIPRTPLSVKAEQYIRGAEPDFLFNH